MMMAIYQHMMKLYMILMTTYLKMRRPLRSKRNLNTSSTFVLKNQTRSSLVHFYSF